MLTNLDYSILRELDHQKLGSNLVAIIMNNLDTDEKKNKFLSYMIKKRNIIISIPELFSEIKSINIGI